MRRAPTSVLPNDSLNVARSTADGCCCPFARSNLCQDIGTLLPQTGVYVPRRLSQASRPVGASGATVPDTPFGSAADSELTRRAGYCELPRVSGQGICGYLMRHPVRSGTR
jgi:hypothetical protein